MRLKSKLGFLALEDFADPEVVDKSTPNAGEPVDDVVPVPEGEPAEVVVEVPTDADPDATAAAPDTVDTDAPDTAAEVPEETTSTAATPEDDVNKDPDAAAVSATVADVDAVEEPPAEDAAGAVDPDAAEVEEEMGAVDDIEDKEADVHEDVEKLEAATESLEVCVAALESAIQRGGLDMIGSVLMRNNINTVTKNLKVKPMMIPALEDMESPDAKIQASSSLKDQLVAFIRKILAAIKGAFDRFTAWAIDTYKRLTNAFVAIERRAQRLGEKAKASEMIEGKIDNKKLAQALVIDNKPAQDIKSYLTKLTQFSSYLNDPASYKNYLDAIDDCEQLLKAPEKAEEIRGKISQTLARWAEDMEKHAKDITSDMRASVPSAATSAAKAFQIPMFNNQYLAIAIPESADGIALLKSVTAEGERTENSNVVALDKAEAIAICALVGTLAKQTRESGDANKGGVKELMAEIKKRKDTITALTNAMVNKELGSDGDDSAMRKVLLFINAFFMSMPKLPVHGINKALPRNLITALDYVAASMGAASGEAAKPADPKLLK